MRTTTMTTITAGGGIIYKINKISPAKQGRRIKNEDLLRNLENKQYV